MYNVFYLIYMCIVYKLKKTCLYFIYIQTNTFKCIYLYNKNVPYFCIYYYKLVYIKCI